MNLFLRHALIIVPLSLVFLFGNFSPAQESPGERVSYEWPQLKGNPGFTGLSPDDSVKPPLKLWWSYRLDGDASGDAGAGLIVAGGKVFASVANSHSIVALNAENGHFDWEYIDEAIGSIGYLGHAPVPTYHEGHLVLWQKRNSSRVVVLDAKSGETKWQKELSPLGKDPNRGGLPAAGGLIYISEGGPVPTLSALDVKSGEPVWQTALGPDFGEYVIGPTVAGGRVFVSTRANTRRGPKPENFRGGITALDAATGEILWRRKNIYSWSPMASDGKVLVCPMWSSPDEKIYLLNCNTGETIWAKSEVANHYNPPITFTKDLLLYQPWGPKLHALSRESGEEEWMFFNEFTSAGCCTPVVSGRYAYIGTSVPVKSGDLESLRGFRLADTPSSSGKYGTVNAIDLSSGKSVWRFPTANTVCGDPAIAYGKLYFASRDGRVYCCVPAGPDEAITPRAKDESPSAPKTEVVTLISERSSPTGDAKNWPMQGGDSHRAGIDGIKLDSDLDLAWTSQTGGRILTSPAILDGVVYAGSESGKIVAIDAEAGKQKWEFDTGAPVKCSPAVRGDVVYCGSDNGIFYALDTKSGKPIWQFEAGGPIQASPAIKGGLVLFGANDHNLYALDRHRGKKLWNFHSTSFCNHAPPVIQGNRVFAASWADWVWCLELETGKPIWKSFIPVSIEAVSWYKEQLWIRSPYLIVKLDPEKGSWLNIAEASYGYGGMAFTGNRIFQSGVLGQYGTDGATSILLTGETRPPPEKMTPTLGGIGMLTPEPLLASADPDPETSGFSARMSHGLLKMEGSPDLAAMGTPLALGDKICFATLGGEAVLTDLRGRRLWTYQLGDSSHATPVAASGLLVVGCDDGNLYAFRKR